MTSVLFIGNSHLAAVKTAWDQAQPKGLDAEFFGSPQRAWARMALLPGNMFGLTEGGDYQRQRKITEEANGKAAVSLDNRDAIVMIGGFSAVDAIVALLAECDVPDLRETGAATLLSEPLFAKACATLATACLPEAGWLNRLGAKLAVLPRPAPADSCLHSTWPGYAAWHRLAQNPTGVADALALYDAALASTFADKGITYLQQPQTTLTPLGLTHRRYLAEGGGAKKGEEHKRGDHAHMNAAYGADCVAQIITWLNGQS